MTSKKQRLDINTSISDNSLNIKRISKNSYKKLEPTSNERIGKNSELGPIPDKRIGKNLYKELRPTAARKIGKSLNKKLGPSFTYNNMHLRKKAMILITEISNKIYKQKSYNEVIADPIHNIR